MNICILCIHQKSYKLDKGIMLIFVFEKNRPLLLAKGVDVLILKDEMPTMYGPQHPYSTAEELFLSLWSGK